MEDKPADTSPQNPPQTKQNAEADAPMNLSQMPGGITTPPAPQMNTPTAQAKPKDGAQNTQQQTPQQPAQPPRSPSPSTVVTSEPKKSSKFKIIIIVLIVLTLVIYGVVAFIYLQNKDIGPSNTNDSAYTPPATPAVTTSTLESFSVDITNGNIVKTLPDSTSEVIIDKNDYPTTGITGFSSVALSLDSNYICFVSLPPSSQPAIYLSSSDGSSVTQISKNKTNCQWLPDSKKFIYTDIPTAGKKTDIFIYDIAIKAESNLTGQTQSGTTIREYKITGLSQDKSKILCSYTQTDTESNETNIRSCEINISSLELTDQ